MAMRLSRMKKQTGFTLIEFAIAMGITALAVGATMLAFRNATLVNQGVTLGQDMSDNIRAGLNLMQQDLIQTGTGVPTGGISVPTSAPSGSCTAGFTNIKRPMLTGTTYFPHCNVAMPAIEPGNAIGANGSDEITLMYQDNSLNVSKYQINQPTGTGAPGNGGGCAGSISLTGASATFDPLCVVSPSPSGGTINPGDLLMFSNTYGNALVVVTSVSWPTVFFAAGDGFGLNQTGAPCGTLRQLENGGQQVNPTIPCSALVVGTSFPPTTVERITMVTYYLDNTSVPNHTQLIRRVNFNAGQTVGDSFQALDFTYNFNDGIATNQPSVPTGYNETQIRSVNISLGSQSDTLSIRTGQYVQSQIQTQVSLRSMAYTNNYH
jgi:Prokaryotic N-terminal methylation motif